MSESCLTYKINENPFKPIKDIFFGDYIGISAVNTIVRPIWMQIDKKKQLSVYTAIINDSVLTKYEKDQHKEISFDKSISFSNSITINLVSITNTRLSAAITKPLEAGFEKIVVKDLRIKIGKNRIVIDTKKLGILNANYVLTFYYNGKNDFTWLTKEEL